LINVTPPSKAIDNPSEPLFTDGILLLNVIPDTTILLSTSRLIFHLNIYFHAARLASESVSDLLIIKFERPGPLKETKFVIVIMFVIITVPDHAVTSTTSPSTAEANAALSTE
jgi:hypothetical protein